MSDDSGEFDFAKYMPLASLRTTAKRRWESGTFLLHQGTDSLTNSHVSLALPWIPYEFMRAQFIHAVLGQLGVLIVDLPPQTSEDNVLHRHPDSDRRITVLRGHGVFVAERNGRLGAEHISQGDVLVFPRNVLHTFVSGGHGMLIESLHGPYVDLTS